LPLCPPPLSLCVLFIPLSSPSLSLSVFCLPLCPPPLSLCVLFIPLSSTFLCSVYPSVLHLSVFCLSLCPPPLSLCGLSMSEQVLGRKSPDICSRPEKVLKKGYDKVGRAYTEELVDLHRRLMALRERNVLQQVCVWLCYVHICNCVAYTCVVKLT
uniref:Uncharacterized protein n=1 Tax=Hucho hucho TaxID=62062 RepID=A0A4W5LK08_9TELE